MIDEDNRDLSGTGSDLGLDEKDENGKDRNHQATYENESQRTLSEEFGEISGNSENFSFSRGSCRHPFK